MILALLRLKLNPTSSSKICKHKVQMSHSLKNLKHCVCVYVYVTLKLRLESYHRGLVIS